MVLQKNSKTDQITEPENQHIAVQESQHQPIAIIGIGCRLPGGVDNPSDLWKLLCDGRDAIIDVPPDRWDMRRFYDENPEKSGKLYAGQGGFLECPLDYFDPLFFGISPREANNLDPQQRLLLEVAWEAIDDAGLLADKLAASDTGVFIGGFFMDNNLLSLSPFNREIMNAYFATGSSLTLLANRISHIFNLKGPSIPIDTACSSSLTAVHYACRSLWQKECNLAFAGGVNVMLLPDYSIVLSKGRFLSGHCRCMAFDDRADGYVRGEGAGIVILKPLSQAIKDNDRIYALIRATGVNHDGYTTGITLPNVDAQKELIRKTCFQAKIHPKDVAYIEAHGTGTRAGDPAEIQALNDVLSIDREPDRKCVVGSIKTNIGHLEGAAGIAGLIKAALCLKHRTIPQNLHFKTPNKEIPFDELCVRIPAKLEPFPENQKPVYAGVNGFGYGGANAHVLLQEADDRKDRFEAVFPPELNPLIIPLSARSEKALKELSRRYLQFLSKDFHAENIKDLCYTLSLRRTHHNHRIALISHSVKDICEKLERYCSDNQQSEIVYHDCSMNRKQKIAFVYTGMGPQWWKMGRELYENVPVFQHTLKECDRIFQKLSGGSIIEEMEKDEKNSRIHQTHIAQPAIFSVQVALTSLWHHWGIFPDGVIGHSIGEIAAAYISGDVSLKDALKIVYHRSRLQRRLAGKGSMLTAGISEKEGHAFLKKYKDVSIAAVNSPSSITFSGKIEPLTKIARKLEQDEIFVRFLKVEIAYHSYQMSRLQEEFLSSVGRMMSGARKIPFCSTVTGGFLNPDDKLETTYWWKNIRQPVRFLDGIHTLIDDGYRHFLEIGPHPVLSGVIKESLFAKDTYGHVMPSLYRKKPEFEHMLKSLGRLYTLGFPVDWKAVTPAAMLISLPGYPFQRERYWNETQESRAYRLGSPGHVFFYHDLRLPDPAWQVELNAYFFPWLKDHRVRDTVVFPGAGYVEAGVAINQKIYGKKGCILENVTFKSFLMVDQKTVQHLHFNFQTESRRFRVYSKSMSEKSAWKLHAEGKISAENIDKIDQRVDMEMMHRKFKTNISSDQFYRHLNRLGLNYGTCFRRIQQVWKSSDQIWVKINGHESAKNDDYLLHPTLLDACFQSFIGLMDGMNEAYDATFIPVLIERVAFYESFGDVCWCKGQITEKTQDLIKGNLVVYNDSGNALIEIQGLNVKVFSKEELISPGSDKHLFYDYRWEQTSKIDLLSNHIQTGGNWLVFRDEEKLVSSLEVYLQIWDVHMTQVVFGESYEKTDQPLFKIRRNEKEDWIRLFSDIEAFSYDTVLYLLDTTGSKSSGLSDFDKIIDHSMPLIHLVQELAKLNARCNLGLVTYGAEIVKPDETGHHLEDSPLWGLGLLINNEHPNIRCKCIDLDPTYYDGNINYLIFEFITGSRETDIAYRDGRRFVKRLYPAKAFPYPSDDNDAGRANIVNKESTYLITGGTSGLGLEIAKWLSFKGANTIVLVSRRGASADRAKKAVSVMKKNDTAVKIFSADMGDEKQVQDMINTIKNSLPPLRGIFHLAMVLDDAFIYELNQQRLLNVMLPKVAGALNLHKYTQGQPLDFFVNFSSISSIIGNKGQGNYIAANAFLDAFSHYRAARKLPSLTINLGAVSDTGVVARNSDIQKQLERIGIKGLSAQRVLWATEKAIRNQYVQIGVFDIDWEKFAQIDPQISRMPRFQHLIEQPGLLSKTIEEKDAFKAKLSHCNPSEQIEIIQTTFCEILSGVLEIPLARIDIHQEMNKLGLTSLTAMEFQLAVIRKTGCKVSLMEILKKSSIHKLSMEFQKKMV